MILLMLIALSLLTACSKEGDTKEAGSEQELLTPTSLPKPSVTQPLKDKIKVKIAALKGPTAIGMVKVMEDSQTASTTNDYDFTIAGAPEEITVGLVKGKFDIAAIPCNLAAILFNKTGGTVKMAGINTLGVLYIVETGNAIHSVEDLKGKTIYSTGLGATPQYILNYILTSHGLDPKKDLKIEYKAEATEVASILEKADNAIAMLPQPFVTTAMMKNNRLRIALDMEKEWKMVTKDDSSVVTGVVVVQQNFIKEHKEAFDAFMKEYETSVNFIASNPGEASELVEKFDIFKAAPIRKALPMCNITLIQGEEMINKTNSYLNILFKQDQKSIGGKFPSKDFYYIP